MPFPELYEFFKIDIGDIYMSICRIKLGSVQNKIG